MKADLTETDKLLRGIDKDLRVAQDIRLRLAVEQLVDSAAQSCGSSGEDMYDVDEWAQSKHRQHLPGPSEDWRLSVLRTAMGETRLGCYHPGEACSDAPRDPHFLISPWQLSNDEYSLVMDTPWNREVFFYGVDGIDPPFQYRLGRP